MTVMTEQVPAVQEITQAPQPVAASFYYVPTGAVNGQYTAMQAAAAAPPQFVIMPAATAYPGNVAH